MCARALVCFSCAGARARVCPLRVRASVRVLCVRMRGFVWSHAPPILWLPLANLESILSCRIHAPDPIQDRAHVIPLTSQELSPELRRGAGRGGGGSRFISRQIYLPAWCWLFCLSASLSLLGVVHCLGYHNHAAGLGRDRRFRSRPMSLTSPMLLLRHHRTCRLGCGEEQNEGGGVIDSSFARSDRASLVPAFCGPLCSGIPVSPGSLVSPFISSRS